MAYAGYLIKVIDTVTPSNDYTFPNSKIKVETYSAAENILYDNAYQDSSGVTHANALSHKVEKIKFNLISMTNTEFDAIMSALSLRYTEAKSRSFTAEFYVPQTGTYKTANVHLNDFETPINRVDDVNNVIYYNEIPLTITVW